MRKDLYLAHVFSSSVLDEDVHSICSVDDGLHDDGSAWLEGKTVWK